MARFSCHPILQEAPKIELRSAVAFRVSIAKQTTAFHPIVERQLVAQGEAIIPFSKNTVTVLYSVSRSFEINTVATFFEFGINSHSAPQNVA
ncbi:MAG: hypothetical protein F6K24_23550 [Okeania sp. SIO2D1]|nr:hypothetical protein [Okeania sp. SIO2D1]